MPEDKDPPSGNVGLRGAMPTHISRYRLLDRIGRGAMGVVFSAQDEVIGRQVALKVLMADLESDPETRARFTREAQAAARLVHPNIITILDAGVDQGRSFIAMQLLEGAPLAAYLKRPEAAALERKLDLMIQVCEGLAAAHGQGIVHRDLKPSNLFVQPDGLLKILDFGVARLANSSMTAAGTMLGTPDYMSPEQARGAPVDARSDVFSAGAVFYFILAGRKPFPGPDLPKVLQQLQFEEPSPLGGDVPSELQALVLGAMAKKVDERPGRIEDMLATLVRFRRQYQTETRRLVATARAHFKELGALIAAVAEAGTTLGLPVDDAPAATVRAIEQRFPALAIQGASTEVVAFERARVSAVVEELKGQREVLSRTLESHRSLVAQLDTAQRALAAGDARGALRIFETVKAACPDSAFAGDLAESARPLAAEQEERAAGIAVHTTAARRALEAHDFATAIAECRQALAVEPAHQLALSLLSEAEQAIGREQRRVALLTQRLTDRASRAIDDKEFELADSVLREADSLAPGSAAAADLRQRLAKARAAAEAADLLHQMCLEEIRRARSVFRRGRYDEAVQQLRGFLEVEPDAQEAAHELERLVALRETLVASAAASRRKAGDAMQRATTLAHAGDISNALTAAREASRFDPADADVAEMVSDLLARQLEERIAREQARALDERTQAAEPLIDAARAAYDRGYLAIALKSALAAHALVPEQNEITAMIERVRSELTSEDGEIFDLASQAAATAAVPQPPQTVPPSSSPPAASPQPAGSARISESSGVFDWAAELIRAGLRRGKP